MGEFTNASALRELPGATSPEALTGHQMCTRSTGCEMRVHAVVAFWFLGTPWAAWKIS